VRECEKFVPPLTTIKQDYEERAVLALRMLQQLKAGECSEKRVQLSVSLIERSSVCDVKNA
jgi:LacI family transcriptional regulator